ncbi:hypothetical protein ASPZODRAFT_1993847 [Penicilliopsis zonata CBS 506.65]|uniref:Uncharacterized protein n=1 Tax=Penicilliopsis zonata CBS 506.65 TaxID=1073090 RepID=A0A1L9SI05_9EURO|nr:hypothetical protein ASPZODRAFT_1993847 [Penicilliopsis zonata CBS 506.65]OJJ46674.1 hypothetical protein ASPZODRAFT_1993847 [Penicilliopsis zonata CBS 506.65]
MSPFSVPTPFRSFNIFLVLSFVAFIYITDTQSIRTTLHCFYVFPSTYCSLYRTVSLLNTRGFSLCAISASCLPTTPSILLSTMPCLALA